MRIKEGFELQNVCGEHIVIPAGEENVDFSRIISLNPTAAYLWENVAGRENFTVEDLAKLLLDEYEVDEQTALEDCKLIAERWEEVGLAEK
ncbi:MAG: PqqD family protein [Bacteroidaceae bacterium]|nr:PqqD family protein [Bacteroidaceae bacterium]